MSTHIDLFCLPFGILFAILPRVSVSIIDKEGFKFQDQNPVSPEASHGAAWAGVLAAAWLETLCD